MTAHELREWMEQYGWGSAALARELGVSRRLVHYWRSGESAIPPWMLWATRGLARRKRTGAWPPG